MREWSPTAGQGPDGLDRNWFGVGALSLVCLAIFARIFTLTTDESLLPWYLVLQAAFLALYALAWWRRLSAGVLALVMALQSLIVLALLSLHPELDFVTGLYVGLSYQAAHIFSGRTRWLFVGTFVALTALSLMLLLGPLRGLAYALIPMAFAVVLPANAVARQEIEALQAQSSRTVAELEAANRRLQAYAGQVQELAAMEERNRLARELHDSVSQTMFSVQLATRSAQMMLEKNPQDIRPQLEHLRELTQGALRHMRGLIADLDTGAGETKT